MIIHTTNILPVKIDFYVRTEKGINTGSIDVNKEGAFTMFRSNMWLSEPYLKFTLTKKKGEFNVNMKGGDDKEAMLIFTIKDKVGTFVKTN